MNQILFYVCPIAKEPLPDLALNILELESVPTSGPFSKSRYEKQTPVLIWSFGIDYHKLTCSITNATINITKPVSKHQIIFAFYWSSDLEDNCASSGAEEEQVRPSLCKQTLVLMKRPSV